MTARILCRLLGPLLAALLLAAGPGVAQVDENTGAAEQAAAAPIFPDMPDWQAFAARVEQTIEEGKASTPVLDDLRAQMATWRDTFLQRQGANAGRITTLKAQIAALGDPPEGETEDPAITARRAELKDQLARLQAPLLLAEEAYARADGMIREIDAIVRERQADRLTERVQSPLMPASWLQAWDAVSAGYRATRAEITTAWSNSGKRAAAVSGLPGTLTLLVAAMLLLLRGRRWVGRLEGLVTARSRRGKGVWRFVLSLGQVILPVIGLGLLAAAMQSTGLLGRRSEIVVVALPFIGALPILAHWIGRLLLFPAVEGGEPPLSLPEDARPRALTLLNRMGLVLAASGLADVFATAASFEPTPRSVITFVFGTLLALVLFGIGRLLLTSQAALHEDAVGPRSFRAVVRGLLGRALMVATVLAVLAGALGYVAVFQLLLFPAAITLYLLGLLVILQRLSVDVYTLLSRIEDGAQDALIPVLIGFALTILALPLLALTWGARVTDLTELWTRFQEGFSIGATRISPTDFLTFAVIFVLGYTITRLLQGALRSSILPRTKLDAGGQNAIVAGVGYLGIFLAAVIAITTAGIDLSGLAIVAGALSVGIGFGLQNIVSNFVSGIILLIERPIAEGDWIEVNGQMGYVRDISVRSTRIETFDRTDVIVPNADLVSGQVTNWTRGNNVGRVIVPVGVAYGTDTEKVTSILQEIGEAHPMVLLNPPPQVIFQGFGADSLDFEIRAILRDVNWILSVKSDMNHAIAKRFTEEGIEIPFAQRDIWLRNPEVLRGQDTPPPNPVATGDTRDHLHADDMPDDGPVNRDDPGETA